MTANKPEVVAWGNDPRKMSETDLLPCPNCNHRAGKATRRAAKGLPFIGLWKVSCQRHDCPLAMIYFHPVEWNRLPRVRKAEYDALQAECEKLRKDAARYQWLRLGAHEDSDLDRWDHVGYVCGVSVCTDYGIQQTLDAEALDSAIDAAMQGAT